jgi:heme/copper-type cytochrome/quinol oxidase subunit 2
MRWISQGPGSRRALFSSLLLAALLTWSVGAITQDADRRQITVTIGEHGYEPARIDVRQNELVQVTFVSTSEPHAFTLDAYRVAKRAAPGRPSTFEFRADQVGSFPFTCTLLSPNGRTHDERGELIVRR